MARERSRHRQHFLLHDPRTAFQRGARVRLLSGTLDGTRVLVVEDNALVTDALRILFEEHGYSVDVAATLAGARARIAARRPDVVFLDLALPDGDALELAGLLDGVAVYVLTGHADEGTRRRCLAAGVREVLVKPAPVAELLRRAAAAAR